MPKSKIYIAIASRNVYMTKPPTTIGEDLCNSIISSNTFKPCYHAGMDIAGIKTPSRGYKTALRIIRQQGAVQIQDEDDESAKITIVQIKKL